MGLCISANKALNNNYYNKSNLAQFRPLLPTNPANNYKFNYAEKNNMLNKRFNLKFIFYDFQVKYCVSHNQTKNSLYITEIRIGDKLFPLIINNGLSPNIPNLEDYQNGYFQQKEYTINELQNTQLLINVFEFLENISTNINVNTALPEEYKQKSNFNSFFQINLLSFLFKSKQCDFRMMGNNQLSNNTRISFICDIEHKEKIVINACTNNIPNIFRLNLQSKDLNESSTTKQSNNCFSLTTKPLTICELQKSDIFLETQENQVNYYYSSLNPLKAKIIKILGETILKEEHNFNINNNNFHLANQLNNNNQMNNDGNFLYFENLPIIAQISNLYFTEYGNLYNTSLLHLVNSDENLQNYRKSKHIFSDDFYNKLNKYYEEISKESFNANILNDIKTLLLRSIENDKFLFLYPSLDNLNKMVILFLKLGLKIIERIKNINETMIVVTLLRIFNVLMKREELDNWVIYECIDKFKNTPNNPRKLYNTFIVELFYLYKLLLSNRFSPSNDMPLIELFSRLYFQNKYIRFVILNTLNENKYKSIKEVPNQYDIFLYDIIYNEKLDEYLDSNTKEKIQSFLENKEYYKNISFNYYKLLKVILASEEEIKINQYPLDFTMFSDNLNILQNIERDITQLKSDNYDKNKLNNDFYEALMFLSNSYFSISRVNNTLIQSTNGHKNYAVYTLFVYFKSLYSSSNNNAKLIMDYSLFELAIQKLSDDEHSISLPRLFWFYYCCYNMTLTGHLKWFIVNIINKNFDKFAYHWSYSIRQAFFKLFVYVFIVKLKDKEGKLVNKEKIKPFLDHNMNNVGNFLYKEGAYKDFTLIEKEFNIWASDKKGNNIIDGELPMFILPPPIPDNNVMI